MPDFPGGKYVCSHCGHPLNSGMTCSNCGARFMVDDEARQEAKVRLQGDLFAGEPIPTSFERSDEASGIAIWRLAPPGRQTKFSVLGKVNRYATAGGTGVGAFIGGPMGATIGGVIGAGVKGLTETPLEKIKAEIAQLITAEERGEILKAAGNKTAVGVLGKKYGDTNRQAALRWCVSLTHYLDGSSAEVLELLANEIYGLAQAHLGDEDLTATYLMIDCARLNGISGRPDKAASLLLAFIRQYRNRLPEEAQFEVHSQLMPSSMNGLSPSQLFGKQDTLSDRGAAPFVDALKGVFDYVELDVSESAALDTQIRKAQLISDDGKRKLAFKAIQYNELRKVILKARARDVRSGDIDRLLEVIRAHGSLNPQHAWNFHTPLSTTLYLFDYRDEAAKVVDHAQTYIDGVGDDDKMNQYARNNRQTRGLEARIFATTRGRCSWEQYKSSNFRDDAALNEASRQVTYLMGEAKDYVLEDLTALQTVNCAAKLLIAEFLCHLDPANSRDVPLHYVEAHLKRKQSHWLYGALQKDTDWVARTLH